MSVRKIIKYDDPILTRSCSPVTEFNEELTKLIDGMLETMYASSGIGLAANQIGVSKAVAVVDLSLGEDPNAVIKMVNPVLVSEKGVRREEEGCLSFPGIVEYLDRPERIEVGFLGPDGEETTLEARDLLARAICHEVDHLNGVTILDRLNGIEKAILKKKLKKILENGLWEEAGE